MELTPPSPLEEAASTNLHEELLSLRAPFIVILSKVCFWRPKEVRMLS